MSLFKHELQANPTSEAAAVQLGYAYFAAGNDTLAKRYYEQAIALKSDGFMATPIWVLWKKNWVTMKPPSNCI